MRLVVVFALGIAVAGCGGDSADPAGPNGTNTRPQITAMSASPSQIADDQSTSISVTATDADNDQLTYTYSHSGGTISGSGATVTFTPLRIPMEEDVVINVTHTVSVKVTDGRGGEATRNVQVVVTPKSPAVMLNAEDWVAQLTTTGGAVYPTLAVTLEQDVIQLFDLYGSNRDSFRQVDVEINGTVDAYGNVYLKSVLTDGGSPRATITFTGTITGTGSNQTISGSYEATGPSVSDPPETGTFTMARSSFAALSAGGFHSCGVTPAGAAYCWGDNVYGQLGDGSTTSSLTPVAVAGGLSFAAVSAGRFHNCGVTTAGEAYCWGRNDDGQLGNTTTTNSPTPVAVASFGQRFAAVSAGSSHSCGVTTQGVGLCWGDNSLAMLGDGSAESSLRPVAVAGGQLSFAAVSAGQFHSCGVTTAAEAYCWGANSDGQLGDDDITIKLFPVPVEGGHDFDVVSAGGAHSCGVSTSGVAYCWGRNHQGQLGDGTTVDRYGPVAVASDFNSLSAGLLGYFGSDPSHSCGVTTAGVAYCWGSNGDGQLGNSTTTNSPTPVAVVGGLAFAAVSAGDRHTCGVTIAGDGYCWGRNSLGQLGDGTTVDELAPVLVLLP